MKTIDISKDFLGMFAAKADIEQMLINAKKIEEEMEIPDFINWLDFSTHIYWESKEKIYPFKIVKTPNEEYMFIANVNKIDYAPLYSALEEIEYDFSKLTKKEPGDIVLNNLIMAPHFILNNDLYYLDRD